MNHRHAICVLPCAMNPSANMPESLAPNELLGDGDSAYVKHLLGECSGHPETCQHCTAESPKPVESRFRPMRHQRVRPALFQPSRA